MNRKWWIQIFIIPNLRSAAAWLRLKDDNSTGGDDAAAIALEHAVAALEEWIATEV
jgi:hypothetical protein